MKTISIKDISISPDRQRRHFDETAMQELINSIETHGLLHPPVIRQTSNGYELVAGERRMRAIQEIWDLGGQLRHGPLTLPPGQIPFLDIGELSPLAAEEVQLDENLRRRDLTWQEHAAAVARLERLRAAQAAESGDSPPTTATLAEEISEPKRDGFTPGASAHAKEQIRKELVVAKYLGDATVKSAKTLDEAYKAVIRKEELDRSAALGIAVGRTFSARDHTLLQGDSLVLLPDLPPIFDVLITDPPYGMGADSFGTSAGRALTGDQVHLYSDDSSVVTDLVLPALELASLKCKPAAHAYIFCDIENFFLLRGFMEGLGWRPFRTPLIWAKPDGRVPLPSHGPRRCYEVLLYCFRGDKPTRKVASDILPFSPDSNLNLAAQKPVALFRELLSRSTLPGDAALDPFCGTGTVFPAAHDLKVRATGIELDPRSYGISAERVKNLP